jgi:hypothetical protein
MSEYDSRRSTSARSAANHDRSVPGVPGRGTLFPADARAGAASVPGQVQRSATAATSEAPAHVHAAARGTATPSTQLPFLDIIQRAFGRHDISGVKAHVGGEAAASTSEERRERGDMGQTRYRARSHGDLPTPADFLQVAAGALELRHQPDRGMSGVVWIRVAHAQKVRTSATSAG